VTIASPERAAYRFDTRHIEWRSFITPGTWYHLLHVDVPGRAVDMLIKFEPHCQCLFHRHRAVTTSLVLEGELRVREQTAQGEVLKVKPAGSYSTGAEDEIHVEGGGEEGTVVFFNMRGDTDVIYELLHSDLTLNKAITVQDFARDLREKWPDRAAA
jgi:hypothetical protein